MLTVWLHRPLQVCPNDVNDRSKFAVKVSLSNRKQVYSYTKLISYKRETFPTGAEKGMRKHVLNR